MAANCPNRRVIRLSVGKAAFLIGNFSRPPAPPMSVKRGYLLLYPATEARLQLPVQMLHVALIG